MGISRNKRRERREEKRQQKERDLEFQQKMVNEVEEAEEQLEEAIRQGQEPPKLDVFNSGVHFKIYSVDHRDYFWDLEPELLGPPAVEFHDRYIPSDQIDDGAGECIGHIQFFSGSGPFLAPFSPPKHAALEGQLLETQCGTYDIEVRFISNDYLFMTVPREVILEAMDELPPPNNRRPKSAPEFFTFACINEEGEKARERYKISRENTENERQRNQRAREAHQAADDDDEDENKWLPQKQNRQMEEYNARDEAEMIELEVLQAKERLQEALQQGQQPPEISVAQMWNLYSVEYVEYFWYPNLGFWRLPSIALSRCGDDPSPDDEVDGHIFFNYTDGCCIPPFSPPKRATLERKVVNACFGIKIQFISDEYVIVTVPRENVFMSSSRPPPLAPATFTFMGKRG
ncbi:hypothetical protein NM208_g9470 [Fusarium decemcellulare]|uniref:Uncharacterized protein n=1 Tax=Fusarium decemcellulare TaxID=57161 RepID=A0ACC1S1K6_9HYPO|nr:hypothetical protein NM208_g9470 [Fusarium decemcellulare]